MNGLQSLIGQMGIFMICAQAIMHFRPKEAYEKYLRLLLSVMILIQVIQPFFSFFQGKDNAEWQVSLEYFQERLDDSMEEAVRQAAESEGLLEQMSLEEVQERLEQQSEVGEGQGTQEESEAVEDEAAENMSAGNVATEDVEEKNTTIEVEQIQVELSEVELSEVELSEVEP